MLFFPNTFRTHMREYISYLSAYITCHLIYAFKYLCNFKCNTCSYFSLFQCIVTWDIGVVLLWLHIVIILNTKNSLYNSILTQLSYKEKYNLYTTITICYILNLIVIFTLQIHKKCQCNVKTHTIIVATSCNNLSFYHSMISKKFKIRVRSLHV